MKNRGLSFAILLIVLLTIAGGVQATDKVVVQIDLTAQENFLAFQNLDLDVFFRLGNIFFAELDGGQLTRVRRRAVPVQIIDQQAFSGHYYFGRTESIVSRKVPAVTDFERLTEVGEQAIYKSPTPIDRRLFREAGFEPVVIIKREIPLTWFPVLSAFSPAIAELAAMLDLDSLVNLVSQDSIYAFNTRLEAFQTRFTFTDSNLAARDWLQQKFADFGYTEIQLQDFWVEDNSYSAAGIGYNVICVKPGTAEPDKIIVIGGHYDSIVYDGNDPWTFAPGSDDNASGTVGVLEVARILANIPTRKTIVFVPFGAEEHGLVGSWNFAGFSWANELNIELMMNMDMIGYTTDDYPNIQCQYFPGDQPYADLMAQLCLEHTWLFPEVVGASGGSDHIPFHEYGYNIVYTEESDFNFPGWHTGLDLTSEMDFPYLTEVIKMVLATAVAVDGFPGVIADGGAQDVGDGQSLLVQWTPSGAPDVTGYRVLWGETSQTYTDLLFVPGSSQGEVIVAGLTENQPYYLTVVAVSETDVESFLRPEFTGTPRLVPLAPVGLLAETEEWRVDLTWMPNHELDFAFYRIYRALPGGSFMVHQDNWSGESYSDTDVAGGVMYDYVIGAVDLDGNESEYSAMVSAAAATFDQGILIVDQTPAGGGNPTQAEKDAFYATVFADLGTAYYYYRPADTGLNKSIIGQYEALFWIDDGNAAGIWSVEDLAKLRWYLEYNTAVFLAGWRTAFEFAGLAQYRDLAPGNLLYDFAGVTSIEEVQQVDLLGGLGRVGFPDLVIDTQKVFPSWSGKMGWNGALGVGGGEGIYTYHSFSGANTGRIMGVRQQNTTSKFFFLSLPFYYLRDADAQAVVNQAADWFGLLTVCDCSGIGDLNGDRQINPIDVIYLIDYALRMLTPHLPTDPDCAVINRGDFDCNGKVDLLDIVKMVNYVYRFPAPGPCDPCGN